MNTIIEEILGCIGRDETRLECNLEVIESFDTKEMSMFLDFFDYLLILPREDKLTMLGKLREIQISKEERQHCFEEWSKSKMKEIIQKELTYKILNNKEKLFNDIKMSIFDELFTELEQDTEDDCYKKIDKIDELKEHEKLIYSKLEEQFSKKSIRIYRRRDGLVDIMIELDKLSLNTTELKIFNETMKMMKHGEMNIIGKFDDINDKIEMCSGLILAFFKI